MAFPSLSVYSSAIKQFNFSIHTNTLNTYYTNNIIIALIILLLTTSFFQWLRHLDCLPWDIYERSMTTGHLRVEGPLMCQMSTKFARRFSPSRCLFNAQYKRLYDSSVRYCRAFNFLYGRHVNQNSWMPTQRSVFQP